MAVPLHQVNGVACTGASNFNLTVIQYQCPYYHQQLSSPRLGNPRVGVFTSCPVTEEHIWCFQKKLDYRRGTARCAMS